MTAPARSIAIACALLSAVVLTGCEADSPVEELSIALQAAEVYQLDIPTGDEDGARVIEQAVHFATSEIRRDSSTNWNARYLYEPATGFVGNDRVLLEVLTGSDGASAPTRRRLISIRFSVSE